MAARLRPGGFYAVNVVDGGGRPRFLFSLIKTLQKDFAAVEAWIERGEAGRHGRVTYVVLASAHPTPRARLSSTRGTERTWVRWPPPDLAARVARARVPLLTDDFAPVDRLMAHVLLKAER